MKFYGETDKLLKIRLPSAIISSYWHDSQVAHGGVITYEVKTQWVSDDSAVKIIIKDLEGAVIDTVEGSVYYNTHRCLYTVSKPNKTGGMYFEAVMTAHKLKSKSHSVKVLPPITWTQLKWMDENKDSITEITEAQIVNISATVKNVKAGAEGFIEIFCRKTETNVISLCTIRCEVKDSKLSLQWMASLPGSPSEIPIQANLEKEGAKYFQPEYFFVPNCYGSSAKSESVKLKSYLEFDFNGHEGIATLLLPDGTKEQKNVPEGGMLLVEKPKVGNIQVLQFVAKTQPSQSAET